MCSTGNKSDFIPLLCQKAAVVATYAACSHDENFHASLLYKPCEGFCTITDTTGSNLRRASIPIYVYISTLCSITSPSVQFPSTHFATVCKADSRCPPSFPTIAQMITASCHLSCKSISATETLNSRCNREINGLMRPRFSFKEAQAG